MNTGFERLRQEGRKQLLKLLEPYLDHEQTCHVKFDPEYECNCGLNEIIKRVME